MVSVGQEEEMIPGSPMVVDDEDEQSANNNNNNNNNTKTNPPLLPQQPSQQQQQENDTTRNNNTTSSSSKKRKKRGDDKSGSVASPSRNSNKARRGGGGGGNVSNNNASTATATSATSAPVLEYQDFCELPLTLKTVLLDEVEKITRRDSTSFIMHHHHAHHFCSNNNGSQQHQPQPPPPIRRTPARLVHDLPATVTIQQVLKHFCKKQQKANKQQQQQQQATAAATNATTTTAAASTASTTQPQPYATATDEQIQNFCQGLTNLFQQALPTVLLYPQERPQYEALVKRYCCNNDHDSNNKKQHQPVIWTEIYGCEYLLRLYVRLPLLMQNPNNIHPTTVWTTTKTTTTENTITVDQSGSGGFRKTSSRIMADDIRIVGPLLTQLLILLQKNRQACFKSSNSFREPKLDEWTEHEKRIMYGNDYNNSHEQQEEEILES